MPSTPVVVGSRVGLHARPAAIIAEAAAASGAAVTIAVDGGAPVDAGSALLIMTLGAKCGDTVVVSSDDATALQTVSELVARDLDG